MGRLVPAGPHSHGLLRCGRESHFLVGPTKFIRLLDRLFLHTLDPADQYDNFPLAGIYCGYVKNSLNAFLRTVIGLMIAGMFWLTACSHTEHITRAMTWSTEAQVRGLSALPEGGVRLTFVQAPKFHVRLVVPNLIKHLESSGKQQVTATFEIQCKRRQFSLIRIRSVDGISVETRPDNMWLEIPDFAPGHDTGPFPDACLY
jgi:hypothetical protein